MNLERKKKSMVVNGKGAPAKKKDSKAKPKKKTTSKKKTVVKAAAPKKRRQVKRKKNPSVDVSGSFVAAGGGVIASLLAGPAASVVGSFVKSAKVRPMLEIGAAGVVPFGLGLGVQMIAPALGKGMCAGAGAAVATRVLAGVAEKAELARKVGYRISSLPADFTFSDGQLFRLMPDGTKKVMFAATPTQIQMTLTDGTVKGAQMLGEEGGNVVILDETGNLRVLSRGLLTEHSPRPADGMGAATPLDGIEYASQLDGTDGYSA